MYTSLLPQNKNANEFISLRVAPNGSRLLAHPADFGFSVSIMSQFLKTNLSMYIDRYIDIETCSYSPESPDFLLQMFAEAQF